MSFFTDPEDHISSVLADDAFAPDIEDDCVYVHDGIHGAQRAFLPLLDLRQDLVRYGCHHGFTDFKTIDFPDLIRDLTGGHSASVHPDNLLVNFGDVPTVLRHDLWIVIALAILRDIHFHRPIVGTERLGFVAIPRIGVSRICLLHFLFLRLHFSFHHSLDGSAQQIPQSILNIFCGSDVVFLNQSGYDLSFPVTHRRGFPWSSHFSLPSCALFLLYHISSVFTENFAQALLRKQKPSGENARWFCCCFQGGIMAPCSSYLEKSFDIL